MLWRLGWLGRFKMIAYSKMIYCEHTVTSSEVDTPQSLKRKQDGVAVHTHFEEQLKQSNMKLTNVENDRSIEKRGKPSLPIAIAVTITLALFIYFVI